MRSGNEGRRKRAPHPTQPLPPLHDGGQAAVGAGGACAALCGTNNLILIFPRPGRAQGSSIPLHILPRPYAPWPRWGYPALATLPPGRAQGSPIPLHILPRPYISFVLTDKQGRRDSNCYENVGRPGW